MTGNSYNTRDRILRAGLDLFLQQGIRKTSIDDVADRAGVTRVTVYRHFADRQQLIGEAFLQVNAAFGRIREALEEESDLDSFLTRMAAELSTVPLGFMSGMAELETLHPEIHADLRKGRRQLLRAIFDELYGRAKREGRLRPGLDQEVVEALFWEVVMTLPESSVLSSRGLSPTDIYSTLSGLLLYGLLKE
ncbi:MAG: TetR/AcrR family transcriptional regulator [Acidimicrobiia bacterium]|nr:TetR/AcrR family transcriptional regulator [Acidimicrobiia bacterium]